jgi:hypothetical protein
MKKCFSILAVVGVIIFSSCHEDDAPTSPSSKSGQFIVDSIGTTISVKIDTTKGMLQTFATLKLAYHFENFLGTLDEISLALTHSYSVNEFFDYIGADSADVIRGWTYTYMLPDSLNGQDSIKIVRQFKGSFWTRDSINHFIFSGDFIWKDSLYVPVLR